MHRAPEGRFWQKNGHYSTLSQHRPIQRFRCKRCGKGFSRQTFRVCYRDRKPHLNDAIFKALCSGAGIRQTARMLRVNRRTVAAKLAKIGRQLRCLHANLCGDLPRLLEIHLDELETFEGCRRTRPVTVPIAIESHSYFVLALRSAPLPPRGMLDARHQRIKQQDEKRFGKRRNGSAEALAAVLGQVAEHCDQVEQVVLKSDRKTSYPGLAKQAFGEGRLIHLRTSSKAPRTTFNPLFPINLTNAMVRDLVGRLHRRSWLVSKKRERLEDHLAFWVVYRNYVRYWRNDEVETPAMLLGFLDEPLTIGQVIGWRQDLGRDRSIHPGSGRSETIAAWAEARAGVERLKAG
jgi:transposase-like protein